MNEEEIKAVDNLKHIVKHWKPNNEEDELANIEYNSIRIAVNLIEKQQKENKYLRDENNIYRNETVSKYKIRNKIKELGNTKGDLATYIAVSERIKVLQELLEG